MTIDEVLTKGFLNLTDQECDTLLQGIYETENPEERMTRGIMLLSSFIPERSMISVLNLVTVILDANDEMNVLHQAQGHVHGTDCNHE